MWSWTFLWFGCAASSWRNRLSGLWKHTDQFCRKKFLTFLFLMQPGWVEVWSRLHGGFSISLPFKKKQNGEKRGDFSFYILIAFLSLSYAPVLAAAGSPQKWIPIAKRYEKYFHHWSFQSFQWLSRQFRFIWYKSKTPGIFLTSKMPKNESPQTLLTKIYDALLGLESGIITPEDSRYDLEWRRLSIRCMGSRIRPYLLPWKTLWTGTFNPLIHN